MEQPNNSSQILDRPGNVCLRTNSLYGEKQPAILWGSLIYSNLKSWGLKITQYNQHFYLSHYGKSFGMLILLNDDMAFASNHLSMIASVKLQLPKTFDMKLYGS